jgi:hypothetical protein
VKDVEREMMLACDWMLVLFHVVGQERVQRYFFRCEGGIFVLEKFSPCGIYAWAWPAKIERDLRVHLPIHTVACLVKQEEVVELDCSEFVWQGDCGDYSMRLLSIILYRYNQS